MQVVLPLPSDISSDPGKTAEAMAAAVSDPFIELHFQKPATIGIDRIRFLNEKLSLSTVMKGGRWAIIRNADAMTPEASNAFLKTLEEPPNDAHIILTSSRPDYLLPTILSRTQPVIFTRLSRPEIEEALISRGIPEDRAAELTIIADGSISSALRERDEISAEIRSLGEELWVSLFTRKDSSALDLTEKLGKDRFLAVAVLDSATSFLRDHILMQLGLEHLIINKDCKGRLHKAATKYPDPEPIGRAISFLQEKAFVLHFNPQYDLFWMDLIIRGRRIILGK